MLYMCAFTLKQAGLKTQPAKWRELEEEEENKGWPCAPYRPFQNVGALKWVD